MTMASSEWHWEQGVKYAIESIKTALLLNGAAGIALMTFAGTRKFPFALIWPVVPFAFGALLSAAAFLAAYLTELNYGNAERTGIAPTEKEQNWRRGQRWNGLAIGLMAVSIFAFAVGIILAALVIGETSLV